MSSLRSIVPKLCLDAVTPDAVVEKVEVAESEAMPLEIEEVMEELILTLELIAEDDDRDVYDEDSAELLPEEEISAELVLLEKEREMLISEIEELRCQTKKLSVQKRLREQALRRVVAYTHQAEARAQQAEADVLELRSKLDSTESTVSSLQQTIRILKHGQGTARTGVSYKAGAEKNACEKEQQGGDVTQAEAREHGVLGSLLQECKECTQCKEDLEFLRRNAALRNAQVTAQMKAKDQELHKLKAELREREKMIAEWVDMQASLKQLLSRERDHKNTVILECENRRQKESRLYNSELQAVHRQLEQQQVQTTVLQTRLARLSRGGIAGGDELPALPHPGSSLHSSHEHVSASYPSSSTPHLSPPQLLIAATTPARASAWAQLQTSNSTPELQSSLDLKSSRDTDTSQAACSPPTLARMLTSPRDLKADELLV
jgi:hypothetical protein